MDSFMNQHTCLRGFWKNGVCSCEMNYATLFSDLDLRPMYCSLPLSEVETQSPDNDFFSSLMMTVSYQSIIIIIV